MPYVPTDCPACGAEDVDRFQRDGLVYADCPSCNLQTGLNVGPLDPYRLAHSRLVGAGGVLPPAPDSRQH
jgi:hypothetical protein